MDKKLFLFLFDISKRNKVVYCVSKFIAKISYFIFLVIYVLGAVYILINHNFNTLIKYILVPAFVLFLNTYLRKIIKRNRPFNEFEIKNTIYHKSSYSFPSNHSACAMVISIAEMFLNFKFGLLCVVLAFFTGLSRVFTGLHFPFDVISGWIIGAVLGYIGFFVF